MGGNLGAMKNGMATGTSNVVIENLRACLADDKNER